VSVQIADREATAARVLAGVVAFAASLVHVRTATGVREAPRS
jgi:hypothetical protein